MREAHQPTPPAPGPTGPSGARAEPDTLPLSRPAAMEATIPRAPAPRDPAHAGTRATAAEELIDPINLGENEPVAPATAGNTLSARWKELGWMALAVPAVALLAALDAPAWLWSCLLAAALAAVIWLFLRRRSDQRQLAQQSVRLDQFQRLQRQYAEVEQLASLGVWDHDLRQDRFRWSAGAFRIFGVNPADGELTPTEFLAQVHPEDQERWREAHRRSATGGKDPRVEYRFTLRSGKRVWVRSIARPDRDDQGQVIGMSGVIQDISGMRAMQQQLAASEAKFRDLTHLSSDWIWESDPLHRVWYLSDSIDTVLGSWARNRLGRRRWESASPVLRVDWTAHREMLDRHEAFEDFEYTELDPEGFARFLSVSGRPTISPTGEFLGYRGVGRDITREKQQRILLEVEKEISQVIREHNDPSRVITELIGRLCQKLGWTAGAYLTGTPAGTGLKVRERWGTGAFLRMLKELPDEIPLEPASPEERAWNSSEPLWVADPSQHPATAKRYNVTKLGAEIMFLSPIPGESGSTLGMMMFFGPVRYQGGEFMAQVAGSISRTLSMFLQRHAASQRLTHASLHDPLTGLPNRVYLTHQLEERLRAGQPVAVMYIDLDRFKIINDTMGHSVGDQVLIEVARRFTDSIRPQDLAGRIGGDEFIGLLTNLSDRHEIDTIARRLLAALEKPFVIDNKPHFLSGSIGVAMGPRDRVEANELIKAADAAMYQVKSEGRNDVRFFTGGLTDERNEQLLLATQMPLAMQLGEIDLFYQPILAMSTRRVVGIEALIRWHHPKLGLLLPERFLPSAAQANLMRDLGIWSIRRAISDRARLGVARHPDVAVSINIMPRQLIEDGFIAMIRELLRAHQLPAPLLRFELIESAFIESPERTVAVINELRSLGARVIIDNFGTGYASLAYLKGLPVDGLKIDRVFVNKLDSDRGNAAIVQAITTMTSSLRVQALAEGVETPGELRALREFDCDQMQGTLISEPLPFSELKEFMESLPSVREMHAVTEAPPRVPSDAAPRARR